MIAGISNEKELVTLMTLMQSSQSEDKKRKKILKFLSQNPSLVSVRFFFHRSILHLAVLKGLPKLVSSLLETYPILISLKDKRQCSAYHYAITHFNANVLEALIEKAPECINDQNDNGKTALHEAVRAKNLTAIRQLAQARASIYIPDGNGETPYSLAFSDTDILQSLITLNLHSKRIAQTFPRTTVRKVKSEEIPTLKKQFSALNLFADHSSPNSNSASYRSADTKSSTTTSYSNDDLADSMQSLSIQKRSTSSSSKLSHHSSDSFAECSSTIDGSREKSPISKLSLEVIATGDIESLQSYLKTGGDPEIKLLLGRPLIMQVFQAASFSQSEAKSTLLKGRQIQQFNLLLKYAVIGSVDRQNRTIFDSLDPNNQTQFEMLHNAYDFIREEVIFLAKRANLQLEQLEEEFETNLYNAGLQNYNLDAVKEMPLFSYKLIDEHDIELAQIVWELCAGINPHSKQRHFDKIHVSNMVQGLLSAHLPSQIIDAMRKFWPYFDLTQKLTANFIVKELLIWDIYHRIHNVDMFDLQFRRFKDLNHKDFPLHANQLKYPLI